MALQPSSSFSSSINGSSGGGGSPFSLNLASPPSAATRARTFRDLDVHLAYRTTTTRAVPPTSLGADRPLDVLETFSYVGKADGGCVEVRLMRPEDLGATVKLLAESFADVVWTPPQQARFLEFWVEQYLRQRMSVRPHAATLVGFYRPERGDGAGEPRVVATAEVSFDEEGANACMLTPAPPRGAPYLCNMTVEKTYRRKHIGENMLKACEELVMKMCGRRPIELYLHCRVVDKVPLRMYQKAGYKIFKTDSFFVWLRFRRRKHLMYKNLP